MFDEERQFLPLLKRQAPDFGISPEDSALPRIALYLAELERWRGSIDLVGNLSNEDLVVHALESAFGSCLLNRGETILDIGSGGGFPGVPLAAFGLRVTLLEPRQRRAAFLKHVVRTVPGLNASVSVDRVERLSGQTFDAATCRAVGRLERLLAGGKFLREGGKLLIWTAEAEALAKRLKEPWKSLRNLAIPGSRNRSIAAFEKCSTGNTGIA